MSTAPIDESRGTEGDQEQLILEHIKDYAIVRLTPDGHIASWNKGAHHLTGYRPEEIIDHHFSRFFTDDDIASGIPDELLRVAAGEGRVQAEGWRVRKDETRFWAHVVITALHNDAGQLQGFVKVTRDTTDRKLVEDELLQRAQELQRLSAEQLQAVQQLERLRQQRDAIERERLLDEERKRIARDLHDGVVQTFFGIGLIASAAIAEAPTCASGQRLVENLARVNQLALNGADQLRQAIFALDDADIRYRRLGPSLKKLAEGFRSRTGVEADVLVTGSRRRLPTDVAEALYATAREGLSNVEHHAQAHAVVIGLHFDQREVTLIVQDDGAGATPVSHSGAAPGMRQFGLRSVYERVQRLNGSLDAGPHPDGGYVLRTRVPVLDE